MIKGSVSIQTTDGQKQRFNGHKLRMGFQQLSFFGVRKVVENKGRVSLDIGTIAPFQRA